ncbi:MAG: arginine--tRNA ligase [Bacteroidales bacterium]|nr:arginine--tRNA ligase [Bacteroidales bacterium]
MRAEELIASAAGKAVQALWNVTCDQSALQIQTTRKEFEGDYTLVVFPLLRISKSSPENTGNAIGTWMAGNCPEIKSFNTIKGFLNITLSPAYWAGVYKEIASTENYGTLPPTGKTIMVEFSSPNTNKPLHLGHVRNNLLGWSVSQLLKECGNNVIKVNLVNDRGIHICKSMLAWKKLYGGKTPEDCSMKGDHLVGDCYVAFNDIYKEEVASLVKGGMNEEEAAKKAPCLLEAQSMLYKWEHEDPEVRALWKMMNGWVYDGFAATYKALGIEFDKTYYESDTYLGGKALVQEGLEKGIFEKQEDGSVWCDLTSDGLDRKLLLRGDGTSVYMTQDLGTACERFTKNNLYEHIYVVGNEQNYHFQVLKLILGKLGFGWAKDIYHLSYGMVELPEGKMKSREGTVVDADDLMEKMYQTARETSLELGKLDDMDKEEQERLFHMIGMGALKYFILKVDPLKTMLFDPKESIDFNGNTGPFIQYTHARIMSILRKASEEGFSAQWNPDSYELSAREIHLVQNLSQFPSRIGEAGAAHSPSLVAAYCYELAKEFNQFYHDCSIIRESDASAKAFRLSMIDTVAGVLRKGMGILGIELPDRM